MAEKFGFEKRGELSTAGAWLGAGQAAVSTIRELSSQQRENRLLNMQIQQLIDANKLAVIERAEERKLRLDQFELTKRATEASIKAQERFERFVVGPGQRAYRETPTGAEEIARVPPTPSVTAGRPILRQVGDILYELDKTTGDWIPQISKKQPEQLQSKRMFIQFANAGEVPAGTFKDQMAPMRVTNQTEAFNLAQQMGLDVNDRDVRIAVERLPIAMEKRGWWPARTEEYAPSPYEGIPGVRTPAPKLRDRLGIRK